MTSQGPYQPSEFARRAGVTVRALHHYDRLGLLKPSGRTAAGYRLYGPSDVARLQQIVTLKFIGFSLHEIKRVLAGADLPSALLLQRTRWIKSAVNLISTLPPSDKQSRCSAVMRGPKWEAFTKIINAIQMQTNTKWTKKYYNDEAQKLLAERRKLWSPELQKQTQAK